MTEKDTPHNSTQNIRDDIKRKREIQRKTTTIIEALRQKYCTHHDIQTSGVEIVFFAKPKADDNAELGYLRNVCLSDHGIRRSGVDSQGIRSLCPNIVDLDLTGNFIDSWAEILLVVSQLHSLKFLNLTRNKISKDQDVIKEYAGRLPGVDNLVLNCTGVTWDVVLTLARLFETLRELHICGNEYCTFPDVGYDGFGSIECLRLNNNRINSWEEVWKLRKLPKLRSLLLSGNPLTDIFYLDGDSEVRHNPPRVEGHIEGHVENHVNGQVEGHVENTDISMTEHTGVEITATLDVQSTENTDEIIKDTTDKSITDESNTGITAKQMTENTTMEHQTSTDMEITEHNDLTIKEEADIPITKSIDILITDNIESSITENTQKIDSFITKQLEMEITETTPIPITINACEPIPETKDIGIKDKCVPITENTDGPIIVNINEQIDENTHLSITDDTDRPITDNKDGQITKNIEEPITENTDRPITENMDGPITENTDGPIKENTDGPITENTDGPNTENTDGPITETNDHNSDFSVQCCTSITDDNVACKNALANNTHAEQLPNLPQLTGDDLREATLKTVDGSGSELLPPFPSLDLLCVSDTHINKWKHLDAIRRFPELTALRIKNIKLAASVSQEDRRKLFIACLPNIRHLNGSEVTSTERDKAECYFVRYFSQKKNKPHAYQALEQKHGKLQPIVDIDISKGYQEYVTLTFHENSRVVFTETVCVREPIQKLKNLISRKLNMTFGYGMLLFHHYTSPHHPQVEEPFEQLPGGSLPISRFDILDGDEIHFEFVMSNENHIVDRARNLKIQE